MNDHGDSSERRLQWRSRRGMLELELALAPFVEGHLPILSEDEQALYGRLLEHDDWDIYDWVQGAREPSDPDIAAIVTRIRRAGGR